MDIFIKLSQFLLSLSLLIILHELGHFIPAKLFKTRVEKFYLFFDVKFSLFKKKIGETVYGIGWLPLGGYVKISGMIDESMDTEQMALPPQPWEFRSKPAWQRLIIMLGGVTVNFILAFLIYIGMAYAYGDKYISNSDLKDGVWVTNPILEKVGIQTGDKIVSVDGRPIERFNELSASIHTAKEVEIERNGQRQTIQFPVDFIAQLLAQEKISLVELRIPFVVSEISEDSKNKNLQKGDIIQSVAGEKITYADQMAATLENFKGKEVEAIVLRDEKQIPVQLQVSDSAKLGIAYPWRIPTSNIKKLNLYPLQEQQFGFFESIPVGLSRGKDQVLSYGRQLKAIFNPETGAYKGVGGFKAIYDIFPNTWSWEAFWAITALLSIMLGVMNLLPIPALDGGHVLFLLYEMISGRKPSDKFLEYAQMIGFFLLIGLLLFANGNDIYKALTR